ncbi:hypothetical protein [Acinetobacter junii]|uniref:hypothetical protein n=1 Tax=Acinetobacter junii TaxID=40215 RepID=UPI00124FE986|nr:hypothetical protein [Acinetobacter junii]
MTKDIEREAFKLEMMDDYNMREVDTPFGKDFAMGSTKQAFKVWQAAKAHEAKKLEGCVVVPKDQTEDWYLDDNANMWITEPDEWLCDLYVGEVQSVEHKEHLITKSDTLYAAIVWDDENQDLGTWEFFKTEEEAEKAAAHCKAMLEAARGGNE